MRSFIVRFAIFITGFLPLSAQNFTHAFTEDIPDNDIAYTLTPAPNGGYFAGAMEEMGPMHSELSGNIAIRRYSAQHELLWKTKFSGKADIGEIVADALENLYVCGSFDSSLTLSGSLKLTAKGDRREIFLAKLSPSGEVVWARHIFGDNHYGDGAHSIAIDSSGNVYLGGNIDFEILVAKFTPDGEEAFRKTFKSSTHCNASGIEVDAFKNIYITGYFLSWAQFGSIQLKETYGVYLAKLDSAGNALWATSAGDVKTAIFDTKIKLDGRGRIYWCSSPGGEVRVGTAILPSRNFFADYFIAQYDTDGNFLWAKNLPEISQASGVMLGEGNYMTVDAQGKCWIAGNFYGTIQWSAQATANTAFSSPQGFMLCYGSDGTPQKVLQTTGNATSNSYKNTIHSLATLPDGTIIAAGSFLKDTAKFGAVMLKNSDPLKPNAFIAVASTQPSAVKEPSSGNITLWPQPAHDVLFLKTGENVTEVMLYDIFGRLRSTFTTASAENTIPLSGLENGVYFLRFNDAGMTRTIPFTKAP